MTTPERDTLTTHEDIRMLFLSRKLGGSAALAEALEMRELYADIFSALDENEHNEFIKRLREEPDTEDPLFSAEYDFEDRVKEAFKPIGDYKLDRITPTSIILERSTTLPADRPGIQSDVTRLIGELEEDGSFAPARNRLLRLRHVRRRNMPFALARQNEWLCMQHSIS